MFDAIKEVQPFFILDNAEEIGPTQEELEAMAAYRSRVPAIYVPGRADKRECSSPISRQERKSTVTYILTKITVGDYTKAV